MSVGSFRGQKGVVYRLPCRIGSDSKTQKTINSQIETLGMESYSTVRQGKNRKAVIPEAFQLRAIQRTSGRVRGNFFALCHATFFCL